MTLRLHLINYVGMGNKITFLGELEQMLLLTVVRLEAGAYGMAIRSELETNTGRSVARGAVYITLDRLVQKGYLRSWLGDSTAARGGRAKRYFELTQAGKEALRASREALVNLWSGYEWKIES